MIDKFYRFDVDGFFREYKVNKQRLQDIDYEILQAADISAVSYSGESMDGGMPGDPTANKVKKRLTLEERKRELEEYFRLYERIMSRLTREQKVIVEIYLMRETEKDIAADNVMNELLIERTSFYKQLRELRRTVSEIADWL